jgi:hypothetical protein
MMGFGMLLLTLLAILTLVAIVKTPEQLKPDILRQET